MAVCSVLSLFLSQCKLWFMVSIVKPLWFYHFPTKTRENSVPSVHHRRGPNVGFSWGYMRANGPVESGGSASVWTQGYRRWIGSIGGAVEEALGAGEVAKGSAPQREGWRGSTGGAVGETFGADDWLDWICLTMTHVLQDILAVLHK